MSTRVRAVPAILIVVIAFAVAAIPAMAGSEGHFDRTLTVTGSTDIYVQTGSGSVTVRRGELGKVEIHGTIRASGWPRVSDIDARIHDLETNPPIDQDGNTIHVGRMEERERHISISYELVVPAETKLRAESGSGDESIEGISGPVEANSGSGRLKLSNIGGEVRARAGSGEITLDSVRGTAHASSGSGSIRATGIAGAMDARTGSGDIKLQQTAPGDVEASTGSGEVEVSGIKGAAHITSGSGSIRAEGEPTGEWRLHTGSGSVVVEFPQQAAFDLAARTGSGVIDSAREIAIQGSVGSHELHGKVHGGGALVDLSTSSGKISIH